MSAYTIKTTVLVMVAVTVALFLCFVTPIQAEETSLYAKGVTWPETMRATRANYQAWRATRLEAGIEFGPWNGTEPIGAATFDTAAFPEQGVDFNARNDADKRLWLRRNEFVDGVPNPLTCPDKAAVYLARKITADAPVTFKAGFGSDDGLNVWLNGTLLLARDVPRTVAPDQDTVDLPLQAGDNLLLVRIYNISGGCGFYFAPAGDPAARLWNQIKADFPLETSLMERDLQGTSPLQWFVVPDARPLLRDLILHAMGEDLAPEAALRQELDALADTADDAPQWLDLYVRACGSLDALNRFESINIAALRRAITHLSATYPDTYTAAPAYLARLDDFEKLLPSIREGLAAADPVRWKP